jgi:hypothetical protein
MRRAGMIDQRHGQVPPQRPDREVVDRLVDAGELITS